MRECKTLDSPTFVATIYGEPASKANSRRLVRINGISRSIKSVKALSYSRSFIDQLKKRDTLFTKDLVLGTKIYYRTKRPDLDESLILDLLQGYVYLNDRQVKARVTVWGLDRNNPRVILFVAPLDMKKEAFDFVNSLP